jgi:hypothetical protein
VAHLGVPVFQVEIVAEFVAQAGGHDDRRRCLIGRIEGQVVFQVAGICHGPVGGFQNHLLAARKAGRLVGGIAVAVVVEREVPDDTGDFGVALVDGLAVLVEVKRRIQPIGRHVADGVGFRHDVFPEFFQGVSLRVDAAHADHGDFIFDFVPGLVRISRALSCRCRSFL